MIYVKYIVLLKFALNNHSAITTEIDRYILACYGVFSTYLLKYWASVSITTEHVYVCKSGFLQYSYYIRQ